MAAGADTALSNRQRSMLPVGPSTRLLKSLAGVSTDLTAFLNQRDGFEFLEILCQQLLLERAMNSYNPTNSVATLYDYTTDRAETALIILATNPRKFG